MLRPRPRGGTRHYIGCISPVVEHPGASALALIRKPNSESYTAYVNAEIIAIGSELLTPFRQDTNSLFLTAQLNGIGVEVSFKTIVGDRRADLVNVTRIALSRADIVIFMGGLGPTEDDLTRECVAETLGRPLKRHARIVEDLRARFAD